MYGGRASVTAATEAGPAPRTMLSGGGGGAASATAGGPSGGSGPGGGGGGEGGGRVELLVFGYACKLFRDDEKALQQEQGRHLIPWMGEASIMIDRSVPANPRPPVAAHSASPSLLGWAGLGGLGWGAGGIPAGVGAPRLAATPPPLLPG